MQAIRAKEHAGFTVSTQRRRIRRIQRAYQCGLRFIKDVETVAAQLVG
jgi:hypothetical protein